MKLMIKTQNKTKALRRWLVSDAEHHGCSRTNNQAKTERKKELYGISTQLVELLIS